MRQLKQLHRGTDGFKRLLILWTLVLTLGTAYTLWAANSVTDRSLERMRGDVTRCFLVPSRLTPQQVAACGQEFDDPSTPGSDYQQVQAQSHRNLEVFTNLQQRVKKLEDAQKGRP